MSDFVLRGGTLVFPDRAPEKKDVLVKAGKRRYQAPRRAEQAAATRRAILAAARDLFVSRGYATTTVADIAERAQVSVDTVYATVKPANAASVHVLEKCGLTLQEYLPEKDRLLYRVTCDQTRVPRAGFADNSAPVVGGDPRAP